MVAAFSVELLCRSILYDIILLVPTLLLLLLIYIYIYIYVYTCVYMCVYIYIYIYTHRYTHTHPIAEVDVVAAVPVELVPEVLHLRRKPRR